jgi:hypothetical protein
MSSLGQTLKQANYAFKSLARKQQQFQARQLKISAKMYNEHVKDKNDKEIRDLSLDLSRGQQLKLKAKIAHIRSKQTLKRDTGGEAQTDKCDLQLLQQEDSDTEEVQFTEAELKAMRAVEEQKAALFDQTKLKNMPSYVFAQVMASKRMRDFVVKQLQQRATEKGVFLHPEDLDIALEYCDRELFRQFRDGQLTLPQFKSKVMAHQFNTHYVVLDDMKAIISP